MSIPSSLSNTMLHLGGVYRDPARVSSDAQRLLSHPIGQNLRPQQSSLMENNGNHHQSLLLFQGTIPISFRGNTYHIPLDVFLPPSYPMYPPICFVRPISTMTIKERHRHVGRDGMVYMPYLHSWRPNTHSLIQMLLDLAQIFGEEPPVWAKPVTTQQQAPAPIFPTPAPTPTPSKATATPPQYTDIEKAVMESKREEEERRTRMEVERLKLEEVTRESIAEAEEQRTAKEARDRLTKMMQAHLKSFYGQNQESIKEDFMNQAKLEDNLTTATQRVGEFKDCKVRLTNALEELTTKTEELKKWVGTVSEEKQQLEEELERDVDSLVQPADIQSRQMIHLACENASITDCLYFLDRALVKGTITIDVHLKNVRILAKRQFLARAHLMKIRELRARQFHQ